MGAEAQSEPSSSLGISLVPLRFGRTTQRFKAPSSPASRTQDSTSRIATWQSGQPQLCSSLAQTRSVSSSRLTPRNIQQPQTTFTLHASIKALTLYPEVQKKAQAQIDSVCGTDRLPSLADRPNLAYIDAIIKEVARWHILGPFGELF
jgi:hypothetical protein